MDWQMRRSVPSIVISSAVILLTIACATAPLSAATHYWQGAGIGTKFGTSTSDTTTLWSNAANWSPSSVPASSEVAIITLTNSGNVNVTSATLGNLYLSGSGTNATGSLIVNSGGNFTVGTISIGSSGASNAFLNGGTVSFSGNFYVSSTAANSTFTLSSGSLGGADEYVGYSGFGTFTQSGGTNYSTSDLYVGYSAGGMGTYNFSAGILKHANTSNVSEYLGYSGSGAFNQTGGTNAAGTLYIGYSTAASGSYSLAGGQLSDALQLGYGGKGTFYQSGGTHSANFKLGVNAGATGTYTLSDGLLTMAQNIMDGSVIGYQGTGNFIQTGGTSICNSDQMFIGGYRGASGSYMLTGGVLYGPSSRTAWSEDVGHGGTGTFTQSGGTHSLQSVLDVGAFNTGSYLLTGGLLNAYVEQIGYGSTGTFTQQGGINQIAWSLQLGVETTASGTYALSNGSLGAGTEIISQSGTASFLQTGGMHTVSGTISIGNSGTFALTAGSLSTTSISNSGSFSVQGGSLAVANSLAVSGLFSVNGTSQSLAASGTVASGGSMQITNGTLGLKSLQNSGSVTLDAGTLNLVTGGTNNAGGRLVSTEAGGAVGGTGLFLNRGTVQGPSSASGNWLAFNLPFKGSTGQSSGRIAFLSGYQTGDSPGVNVHYGAAEIGGIGSEFDLGGTTPGTGNGFYGQLALLTNPSDAANVGDLTFLPGASLNVVDWNGFVPSAGDQYTILNWDGALTGTAAVSLDPAFQAAGIVLVPQWNDHSLVLTAQTAPEPATFALLAAAGAIMAFRFRRYRRI